MSKVDNTLEFLGYVKTSEDKLGVTYERVEVPFSIYKAQEIKKHEFTHKVKIYKKLDNKSISILSCDGYGVAIALTIRESKLFNKKCDELTKKYKW